VIKCDSGKNMILALRDHYTFRYKGVVTNYCYTRYLAENVVYQQGLGW